MAGSREINKVINLNIRISEKDMSDLEYIAKNREMSKSEMVLYLIRREADKVKDFENRI